MHDKRVVGAYWRRVAGVAVVLTGVGIAYACSDSSAPNTHGVTNVVLTPDTVALVEDSTAQLSAQPVSSSGTAVGGLPVFWSSSDSLTVSVSQSGVIKGLRLGTASIAASALGVSSKHPAQVTVIQTPVATLVVAPSGVTLRVGNAFQFSDTAKDANGNVLTGRTVTWLSSDTNIAPIDQSGLVIARKAGTTVITARSGGATGTATVTVSSVPVKKIVIAPAHPTVVLHEETQLSATTQDSAGNILSGRAVTWTSRNTSIATVDPATGLVTGVAVGADSIIATSESVSAGVSVTVQAIPINAVLLSPQTANLLIGQGQTLTATVTDNTGTPIPNATVTFSSGTPAVATVTSTGALTATVTAVAAGTAKITGTSGTQSGTSTITVGTVPVRSVVVTPANDTITQGGTVQLTATPKDSVGNTLTGRTATWSSSNAGVAKVSTTGLVTGVAPGTTAIFATIGGVQGNATVTIRQIPVGSVTITPAVDTVSVSSQRQLSVVVKDSIGNTLNSPSVTWSSSNSGVAFVNGSGLVLGVGTGTARIIAQSGTKADTNTTVVVTAQVAHVTINPAGPSSVVAGQSLKLQATLTDANNNALPGQAVTWSSSAPGTATVTAGAATTGGPDTATATGVAAGPVTITATAANNVSDTLQLTVTPSVTGISLTPNPVNVHVAFTQQVSAQVFGPSGQITNPQITWATKSGGTTASVNATGLVRGVAVGTDTLIVTSGGTTAREGINVSAAPVDSVAVSPATSTINESQTQQLTATTFDSLHNQLTGRPVTWSSNNASLATVSTSGLVTPAGGTGNTGTATITATSGSASATATVTITAIPVTGVVVAPPSATIYASGASSTQQFTATTTPTGQPVTWGTTAAGVVGVGSTTGLATGAGYGTATITATSTTSPGASGNAGVTVIGHVATVTVGPPGTCPVQLSTTLNPGGTTQLTVTFQDISSVDISGQPQPVTWTSSDFSQVAINGGSSPVTVNPANSASVVIGLGTAPGLGNSATITATSLNGTSGSCTVNLGL